MEWNVVLKKSKFRVQRVEKKQRKEGKRWRIDEVCRVQRVEKSSVKVG